jgi:hypothetical protein
VDDNYGLDQFIRREMKKVFPELTFVELPYDHQVYRVKYNFPDGLPKVHEHDGKQPQGFGLIWQGGWYVITVTKPIWAMAGKIRAFTTTRRKCVEKRLQMGANLLSYAFMIL